MKLRHRVRALIMSCILWPSKIVMGKLNHEKWQKLRANLMYRKDKAPYKKFAIFALGDDEQNLISALAVAKAIEDATILVSVYVYTSSKSENLIRSGENKAFNYPVEYERSLKRIPNNFADEFDKGIKFISPEMDQLSDTPKGIYNYVWRMFYLWGYEGLIISKGQNSRTAVFPPLRPIMESFYKDYKA